MIELDLSTVEPKKEACLESLFLLCKEGFLKGAHVELRDRQDATSRYIIAALMLENSSVISAIRRELRRVVDVLVSDDEITKVLKEEVIKRDAMEGPDAEAAARRVNRLEGKAMRSPKTVAATPCDDPVGGPPDTTPDDRA